MTRTRSSRRGKPAPTPVDTGTETEHEENDVDGENESLSDASEAASNDEGSQLTRTRSQTPTGSDAESEYSSSAVDAQREVLIEQRLQLLQMSQRARNRMLREFQALYKQGQVNAGTVLACNEDEDDSIVDNPAALLEDPPRLTPELDFVHTEWKAGPLSPLAVTPQSEVVAQETTLEEVAAPGATTPAADPGDAASTYADASERMDIDEEPDAEGESRVVIDSGEDVTDQAVSATVTDRESAVSATTRETESDLQVDPYSQRPAADESERPSPAPSRSPETEAPTDEAEVEAAATMSAPEDAPDAEPADSTEQADQTMEVDDVTVDQSLGVAPAEVQPPPPPRPRIPIDPNVLLLPPRSPGGSLITFAPPSPRRLLLNAPQPLASSMILEGMDLASPSDNATLVDQGPIPESDFSRRLPLPPLASLPSSFNILTKPAKLHRRREKERKESLAAVGGGPVPGAASSDLKATLAPPNVQEYIPLGMNRWAATIRANPVHKLIKKAPKVLLTSDWRVAHDELMFMRGMEKIDKLKQDGLWSFRQPKRQKNPTNVKVHWDYVLDEMKWMRTDFREERKWKLAMAHQLAHAVVEWHETPEDQRHVLCSKFPRLPFIPYNDDELEQQADDTVMAEADAAHDDPPMVVQGWQPPPPGTPDPLGPPSPERFGGLGLQIASGSIFVDEDIDPLLLLPAKTEEADFDLGSLPVSALHLTDLVAANGLPQEKIEDQKPGEMGEAAGVSVLRPGSQNPLVGNVTVGKLGPYPQYRDPILNLDDDELWLDLEKLAVSSNSTGTTADTPAPQTPAVQTSLDAFVQPLKATLPEIFPELEVYDAFSAVGPDGNIAYSLAEAYHDRPGDKRTEEVQLGRLTSTSIYMDVRPTLLSALNPAEKFKNGVWTDLEDTVVLPSLVPDDTVAKAPANRSELFGSYRPDSMRLLGRSVPSAIPVHPQNRANELYWTAAEDDLLKALVDKFHGNWSLIADWFNSSRTTIAEPSDTRTPWDCCERWQRLYGAAEEHARSPSPPPLAEPPMPGVKLLKRTAATALSNPPTEPLKRRRTMQFTSTMSTVRKKRADTNKATATAIKRAMTSSTHETHLKISKASYSVADMIALKVTKDREELLRQQAIRAAANVPAALAQQMPNMNAQAQRMVLGQGQRIATGDRNGAPQQYPPQVIAALRAQAQAQAQAVASASAAGGAPLTDQQLQALRMNMPNIPGIPNLSNINLQGMPPERVQALHQQLQRQTALRMAQQQAQATMAAQAAVQQVVQQQQNGGAVPAPGPSTTTTNGTHSSPQMAQAQPASRPGSSRPPSAPHMDAASIQMAQQQAVHAMMQNYSNEEQIRQRVNLQNMIGANGVASSPAPPNGAPAAGHR